MNREQTPYAWMIRRDGTAFPCIQHIYGSDDCMEETLYAAEWLYKHTADTAVRQLTVDFISAWGASLNSHRNSARNILREIPKRPYVFLSANFVRQIAGEMRIGCGSAEMLNRQVNKALNEEFLRCRYGGMYHTKDGNRDLYFRISSENEKPWLDVIDNFVDNFPLPLTSVTVLWDEESTGKCDILLHKIYA